jgi:hypothetical protein
MIECPGHCSKYCPNFIPEATDKKHEYLTAEDMGVTTDEWGLWLQCSFQGCNHCFPDFVGK